MLTPILRRSGREESRREKEHMEAEVVAAYFWLSLGTDVGYFPRPFAVRLAKHRFTEFLNTWHDLFATRGDLFAPDFRIALETIENRRNTVLPPSEPFENLKLLQLFFREALAIEIGTLRDQPLVTSMAALTLLNIADLEEILLRKHDQERHFPLIVGRGLFETQFPATILHMNSLGALESEINESELSVDDRVRFRSRIRALTRWRLNFRLDTVASFFPVISDAFYTRNEELLAARGETPSF